MTKNVDERFLSNLAYVQISTYRARVVKAIGNDIKIPTAIANDSGIRTNHISKVLGELKEHGIAVCINEEMRKGRLYRLTPLGKQIYEILKLEN